MRALVIGGTRNLGPSIVQALLEGGYDLTVFNRGLRPTTCRSKFGAFVAIAPPRHN